MLARLGSRKRIFAAIVTIYLMTICLPPCLAQAAVGADGTITDIITGRNNKGPFTLSWSQIDSRSVSVVLDSRTLRRGQDYNIDLAAGTIAFNAVLLSDRIVRVSYKTTPGKSKPNTGQINVPVSMDLVKNDSGSIAITGLYKQDDAKNPDAGKMIVGFGGNRNWSKTKINSQFLIGQKNGTDDATANPGSAWDKSTVKFGTETNLAGLVLTGQYQHAGQNFIGGTEYGTAVGKDTKSLAGAYAFGKGFQARFNFVKNEDIREGSNGAYTTSQGQDVAGALTDSTNIAVRRMVDETGNATGVNKTVATNSVQIDQKVGQKVTAGVNVKDSTITTGDVTDEVKSQQVAVGAKVANGVDVKATMNRDDSKINGTDQTVSAAVSVAVVPQVQVNADYSGGDSEKNGGSAKTNVSMSAKVAKFQIQTKFSGAQQKDVQQFQRDVSMSGYLMKRAKIMADFSQKGTSSLYGVNKGAMLEVSPFDKTTLRTGMRYIDSGSDVLTIRDYYAETNPWTFFSLRAAFKDRKNKMGTADDTTNVKMAVSPYNFLSFTGDYQANPEDVTSGLVQPLNTTSVGMNMRFGSVALITQFTEREEYTLNRLSQERNLGLEMPFFGRGKLSTGVKEARANTVESMKRTYTLGYSRPLGGDLDLSFSGYYTQLNQSAMADFDKPDCGAEAKFGIRF